MIEILYFYILPPLAISSFAYIIYMWTSRKTYFEETQEISKKAIIDFYEETAKNTALMIDKINQNALEKLKIATNQTSTFAQNLEEISGIQEKLNKQLRELQINNARLIEQNHKKDAILERKIKLIQKLKGEKNVF